MLSPCNQKKISKDRPSNIDSKKLDAMKNQHQQRRGEGLTGTKALLWNFGKIQTFLKDSSLSQSFSPSFPVDAQNYFFKTSF